MNGPLQVSGGGEIENARVGGASFRGNVNTGRAKGRDNPRRK